jgi:hypothetical protein
MRTWWAGITERGFRLSVRGTYAISVACPITALQTWEAVAT